MKTILFSGSAVLLVLCILCGAGCSTTKKTTTQEGIEVTVEREQRITPGPPVWALGGQVTNTGAKPASKVFLNINFLDDQKNLKYTDTCELLFLSPGSERITREPLAPGSNREFRCYLESLPDRWNGLYTIDIPNIEFEK